MTRYLAAPILAGAFLCAPVSASARSGFSFGFHSGPAFYPAPAPILVAPPPVVVVRPRPVCAYPVAYPRPYYGGSGFHFSYWGR